MVKKSPETKYRKITHFFHIVDNSPWPFCISIGVFSFFSNLVGYMHHHKFCGFWLIISFLFILVCMGFWFRDIVREATDLGKHTSVVVSGLRIGFICFILSEVLFFFGFFWGFFHCSLDPAVQIGCVWPPYGIHPVNPFSYSAFFGTSLLLLSGCTLTAAHYCLRNLSNDKLPYAYELTLGFLFYTVFLGVCFTVFQFTEYRYTDFNISDGIYGSTFFMITGFHGLHVIIGSIFLFVQFIRLWLLHYGSEHHFGLEAAIWYWHFVDVVWIFVYTCVYVWGSSVASVIVVNL